MSHDLVGGGDNKAISTNVIYLYIHIKIITLKKTITIVKKKLMLGADNEDNFYDLVQTIQYA